MNGGVDRLASDRRSGPITKGFNVLLFGYLVLIQVEYYLFKPHETVRVVPWERFFEDSPVTALGFAIVMLVVLLFGGAALVRRFWNGWFAEVFKVRAISYQEAFAVLLVLDIFFGE